MPIRPFALERFFAEHEFAVRHVLAASDSESMPLAALLALEPGADQAFGQLRLGYTESSGAPALRQAVAGIYATIGADEVLVCAGAEEGIFTFVHGVLAAGDHVIVQTPCYQSVLELPRSVGCEVTAWPLRFGEGWVADLDALSALLRPDTRAIFVNTPHNPTGAHFSREAFDRLVGLARRQGVLLFCDEVYRELEHDHAHRLPAACDVYEHAVSLGVMSKTYGLPGLRIGWVASRRADVRAAMAKVKDYTTICSSAPSEWLATLALRHREALVRRNLAIARGNKARLAAFVARRPDWFSWIEPHAGTLAFPRVEGAVDVDRWCLTLIERAGVLLAPGSLFDVPAHVRIGFGRLSMPDALAALDEALDTIERRAY